MELPPGPVPDVLHDCLEFLEILERQSSGPSFHDSEWLQRAVEEITSDPVPAPQAPVLTAAAQVIPPAIFSPQAAMNRQKHSATIIFGPKRNKTKRELLPGEGVITNKQPSLPDVCRTSHGHL